MRPAPLWSIPGVGRVHPRFDRIKIVSSTSVGVLKNCLRIVDLQNASHRFDVITYRGPDPRLGSIIVLTLGQSLDPLRILANHKSTLGHHWITQVEVAFDSPARSIDAARKSLFALVEQLGKFRHQRGHLLSVHKPDKNPSAGCVSAPTFYLERRKSTIGLKCYMRYRKLAGGGFGRPIVRLEWTLTGKAALARHLGGHQINDLLTADLNAFLERNIRLERVDHIAFGKLFSAKARTGTRLSNMPLTSKAAWMTEQWNDPKYCAERAASLVSRVLAYRELDKLGDWEQALWICQNSPAQIRGYLRELREGKRPARRGRPKKHKSPIRTITDYQINRCFQRIELTPYNYASRTKINT